MATKTKKKATAPTCEVRCPDCHPGETPCTKHCYLCNHPLFTQIGCMTHARGGKSYNPSRPLGNDWYVDYERGLERDRQNYARLRQVFAAKQAATEGEAGGRSEASSAASVARTSPVASHESGRTTTAKKPGVIARIVTLLRDASPTKPITKEQILADLVETFPDRKRDAMKSTIGSQIPCGLKTEKNLDVQSDDDGGYWLETV